MILQTLQQLRDVYGDSVDKIVQGNTSNIVFLKSTDDSMLDTLQKMSGTTHRAFTNSKTITRDTEAVFQSLSGNEGKTSYTMTVQEVPVISYNDMAFIAPRNSIVFRAGDSPIWNRNETILPMSWKLRANDIVQPGREYTFQTIPTLSSAKDFDVRKNQPDFGKMLDKRMKQALAVESAIDAYMSIYDYTEYQVEQLDPDVYAGEIMEVVNTSLQEEAVGSVDDYEDMLEYMTFEDPEGSFAAKAEDNPEQAKATSEQARKQEEWSKARYAKGLCSRENFLSVSGIPNHSLDNDIIAAYHDCRGDMWQDNEYFVARNGSLYGVDGTAYIVATNSSASLRELNEAAKDKSSRIYAEEDLESSGVGNTVTVTDGFLRFLVSLESWDFANGRFDEAMARRMAV